MSIMKNLTSITLSLKNNLHHFLVFVLFIVISVSYFSPILEGEKIYQSDIVQYTGMAKEQNDFRNLNFASCLTSPDEPDGAYNEIIDKSPN